MIERLKSELGKGIKISMEEMKKYFEKNRERFVVPKGYKIRIITVKSLREAEEILRKLKKGEIDFDRYALNQPNKFARRINRINEFINVNLFPVRIREKLKHIKAGEYEGPIKEKDRFHIIKVLAIREERPLKFEEVKDDIFHLLLRERKEKLLKELLESKRKRAKIEILATLSPHK